MLNDDEWWTVLLLLLYGVLLSLHYLQLLESRKVILLELQVHNTAFVRVAIAKRRRAGDPVLCLHLHADVAQLDTALADHTEGKKLILTGRLRH